jgi:hypothetical protein
MNTCVLKHLLPEIALVAVLSVPDDDKLDLRMFAAPAHSTGRKDPSDPQAGVNTHCDA